MIDLNLEDTRATIWISGVTASGKTTLGRDLHNKITNLGLENTIHLDGDELRSKQSKVYGHSLEERMELIQKYIEIVIEENSKGKIVIISTVSHKKEMRDSARKQLENFMEVNLLCDSEICSNRDYKDIYNRIDINSDECLPGVTEPYILSEEAELILDTGTKTLKDCEDILFRAVLDFLGKINTKSIEI